jgi:hypothetical protein
MIDLNGNSVIQWILECPYMSIIGNRKPNWKYYGKAQSWTPENQ